ncbi:MAG: 2-oxoglutarate dehydrogenase E1 component [Silvanigrellaceae bacterium]|nr:2-oxoglutarate dehydrogenase E1 component [Silvanigrellaceae bacterium]
MKEGFDTIFQSNTGYVDEMFAKYSNNPNSVSSEWKSYFEGFHEGFLSATRLFSEHPEHNIEFPATATGASELDFEFRVVTFVLNWKSFGHFMARTNPIFQQKQTIPELTPEYYGIKTEMLTQSTYAGTLIGLPVLSVGDLYNKLKEIYAGSIGAEIEHIANLEEKQWLHNEFLALRAPISQTTQKSIFHELAKADALEKTIATKYVGKKRFSIEGSDAQIVAIESFMDESAKLGTQEFSIGIAHRGRLNFLINVVEKPLENLFAEFEGYPDKSLHGDNDVKYHFGYESERTTRSGQKVRVALAFNPSHLEYVDAIVMGDTRARQNFYYQGDTNKVVPLLFHGDAAIAGQGIVYEVAQMMTLRGYQIGGTIHVVANNQVGFTTDPKDARSSPYCTDIAKVTNSPVFHVNTDDVEAVHLIMSLAARYRAKFKKDFYVDLICFRKYGHNESDEPSFTQPLLYKEIKDKPAPYETYLAKLTSQGIKETELNDIYSQYRLAMNSVFDKVKAEHTAIKQFTPKRELSHLKLGTENDMFQPIDTKVDIQILKELSQKISSLPEGFNVNQKLLRIIIGERKDMAEEKKRVDWGMGELLAYASLLNQGFSIRLAGEDAQRGTFAHRHVTMVDALNGSENNFLKDCAQEKSQIEVINSLLSEEGAMGYEYGYAVRHPKCLVLWEAQFGDFVNGAQVIIDQFLSSGETKWLQTQGLVLLLPHGMEGQGPEHSSARLERFLQLCAQGNMQVCYFTNAAQLFHALRRQMLRDFRKPLVVMTPKSFLRSPHATTTLQELAQGRFHEILDDLRIKDTKKIKKVILCSGKIAIDLLDSIDKDEYKSYAESTAILRIEQLYPLHKELLKNILGKYKHAQNYIWVQEEAKNYGAWSYLQTELSLLFKEMNLHTSLHYVGRSRRASTAVGIEKQHGIEQNLIIKNAFEGKEDFEV